MLTLVVAMAKNRAIGKNNQIPWHLPADLAHFANTVRGKNVLFGENTYKSVSGYYQKSGRKMPYGQIFVLSDNPDFTDPGVTIFRSKDEVLERAKTTDLYICGGMGVYATFLPYVDTLNLTFVEADIDGDAFFPEIDFSRYKETSRTFRPKDAKNAYDLSFVTYERIAG